MSARLQDVFLYDLQPQIAAMPVSVDVPVETEIQLCRTGAFYRRDQGHFKVTATTLQKMVDNAVERGVDLPINYFHKGNDPKAPKDDRDAAGWVKPGSLSIRSYKGGYALFGVACWTAEAVTKLKGQKLRYISPEIDWVATRMSASEAGPAGAPIGPMLTGAALVNDPFFTLNPVVFSRPQSGSAKRYSMLSDAKKAEIEKLLKGKLLPEVDVQGLMAQILVAIMSEEAMPAAPEVVEVEAAAAPAATTEAAQQSLAASRESSSAMGRRLAELEAKEKKREEEEGTKLFARYQAEGRFRVYAREGADPTGEKKAKEHYAKGINFFREVFEPIPPLVGQRPPVNTERLATAGDAGSNSMTAGQGAGLHKRVMDDLKAKNLTLQTQAGKDEYNRLTAHYSR